MSKNTVGILMVLMLLSCKSQKVAVKIPGTTGEKPDIANAASIVNRKHAFQTMKVKRMNVEMVINGVSQNFRANMAIARDSMIVVSIIPLMGYEAMRIICSEDSLIIINRNDKTFHASTMESYLNKYKIHARYKDLQAVFTNEAFIYRYDINAKDVKEDVGLMDDKILYHIALLVKGTKLSDQTITAEGSNYHIRNIMVEDYKENMNLSISYEGFRNHGPMKFPEMIYVNLKERKNYIKLGIAYGQVIFDEPFKVNISIPESYLQINL
jgi:hypothetical protein